MASPSPLANETPIQSPPPTADSDASSSDPGSDSGSDSDAVPALAVTRERRDNAGNRMAKLIQLATAEDAVVTGAAEEGEEGYAEIFQEAADDIEFQGTEDDDADVSMSSSESGDEQQGDEEEGEKELQREERPPVKKRKRETLLQHTMRLKRIKETRVAQDKAVQSDASSSAAPRPKKKSERVSWLPDAAQVRASSRKLAVANKQATHQRLKESEKRRLKTLAMMEAADERRRAKIQRVITQEERLAQAAIVEKQNSRSLSRWEEAEKMRMDEQRERLEALKNRKLDGPVITYWSGPSVWINDKLKRVGRSPIVEEIEAERDGKTKKSSELHEEVTDVLMTDPPSETKPVDVIPRNETSVGSPMNVDTAENVNRGQSKEPNVPLAGEDSVKATDDDDHTANKSQTTPLLDGIEYYASLSKESTKPSTPTTTHIPIAPKPTNPEPPRAMQPEASTTTDSGAQQTTTSGSPMDTPDVAINGASIPDATAGASQHPIPRLPPTRSLALRSLIILTSFTHLTRSSHRIHHSPNPDATHSPLPSTTPTGRLSRAADRDIATLLRALFSVPPAPQDPNQPPSSSATTSLDTITAPSSRFAPYDPLVPSSLHPRHSTRYLSKRATPCPVTGAVARYRDPLTGMPYANASAFKMLRAVAKGERGVWSGLIQAWVGESKAARGVPIDVWEGKVERKSGSENGQNGSKGAVKEVKA
jgi:vacuolar protein sorting-associated protein 72